MHLRLSKEWTQTVDCNKISIYLWSKHQNQFDRLFGWFDWMVGFAEEQS